MNIALLRNVFLDNKDPLNLPRLQIDIDPDYLLYGNTNAYIGVQNGGRIDCIMDVA